QLPAPVLAVLIRNLRERKAIDRYDRLMHELVQVRQEMGYPPMAAPINRIAANQALANTLSDKRYQHIDQPFRDYVKGLYGAPPAPAPAQAPVAAAEPPASPGPGAREFTVEVDGEPYRVRILADGVPGVPPTAPRAAVSAQSAARPAAGNGAIQAPMQGMVVKVKVAPGDKVRLGDVVVILEAMKMQNDIVATLGGTVREVFAKEGAIVAPNEVLMTIG